MHRAFVGTRSGKPVINWPVVLLTSLMVGVCSGLAGATIWFLLTREFHYSTILFTVALSVGLLVGESIRRVRSTPRQQLPPLD
jgi:hypothetical protein